MFLRGRKRQNGGAGGREGDGSPAAVATGTALVPTNQPSPRGGRPLPRNRGPSIVAADLHVVGNVITEGELHIDGRIDGDVEGRSVMVGETGYVDGHIETQDIVVRGLVRGSIRARRVHLVGGCRVVADISHDSLSIDEGASFEGNCRRVTRAEEPEDDPLAHRERVG